MSVLIKILQLILSLSILVVLHEMGHFVAARIFKVRVEKFYLFFNPWFSLFKYKYKETEYGIGWLPLGGYVKISGMIDESMDKEQMKQPPQPWE
ncbi:MAG: RIP metalloprotease RseP, partial [Bacteroidetes bacterium]